MKSERPNARRRVLPAKVNDAEYDVVAAKAEAAGKSLAAWVRERCGLPPAQQGRPKSAKPSP